MKFNTGKSLPKVGDDVRMRALAAVGDDPDGSGAQIVFSGKTNGVRDD